MCPHPVLRRGDGGPHHRTDEAGCPFSYGLMREPPAALTAVEGEQVRSIPWQASCPAGDPLRWGVTSQRDGASPHHERRAQAHVPGAAQRGCGLPTPHGTPEAGSSNSRRVAVHPVPQRRGVDRCPAEAVCPHQSTGMCGRRPSAEEEPTSATPTLRGEGVGEFTPRPHGPPAHRRPPTRPPASGTANRGSQSGPLRHSLARRGSSWCRGRAGVGGELAAAASPPRASHLPAPLLRPYLHTPTHAVPITLAH